MRYPQSIHSPPELQGSGFAVTPQQLESAAQPLVPARSLVEPRRKWRTWIVRPYLVWRDDLALARFVNDQLAPPTGK